MSINLARTLILFGAFALSLLSANAKTLDGIAIESAQFLGVQPDDSDIDALVVKTQILLDRAGFSPGEIDGKLGENVKKALRAYSEANGLPSTTTLNHDVFERLTANTNESLLVEITVTEDDVKGPFLPRKPKGLDEMKGLERLAYRDAKEALAERHHMSETLLAALNPHAEFSQAGTTLMVANVLKAKPSTMVTRIEVNKDLQTIKAFSQDNALVAFYPATVGSEEKPSPSGTLKVLAVRSNPFYRYNPDYKFKGVKARRAFTINPGPNNPVGSTWIALSERGYGIHGASEPSKVSKAQSNGCVRLTNWDAAHLARMVKKGVTVEFREATDSQVNARPAK
jgi:lipoprotein-anchoring transpeptidase ErfK/SrfK